ncbi:uncharacterized protein LOC129752368 [Uranotaenia lowii]|uniref:uncharacterized protein LOC129752368 n=1 Tax=Uranotaenia lowii TaxID=190385 RepID=UPI002478E628|nr:uncharacterized protein LOC129752368 [Uranotaenia lowii]
MYIRNSSRGFVAFFVLVIFAISITRSADEPTTIKFSTVQGWAAKLGGELASLGDFITRRKDVEDSFKQAQVASKNGQKIVEEMAKDLKYMMDAKVSAVKSTISAGNFYIIFNSSRQYLGIYVLTFSFNHFFQFQDILKPAYNTVDMIEVELTDDDRGPRDFNPALLHIRESIINQSTGAKWVHVKYHFDDMKRVSRTRRQYYWTPIKNTPFTLVVTYPETYGVNRLQIRTEDEIHRIHAKGSNVASFFSGTNWRIHPDWVYCKYLNEHSNESFPTPESELKHFLERMKQGGWKWPALRTPPPPEHAIFSNISTRMPEKDYYYCDRSLMQALVYDAKVTEWFSKNTSGGSGSKDEKTGPSPIAVLMGLLPRNEFKQRFGVTVSFLATHSGLTRWQDHMNQGEDAKQAEPDFSETNNRAIDEIWYKRAVELFYSNKNRKSSDGTGKADDGDKNAYVYSVPFDSGNRNDTLVTASNAIFHTDAGKETPVAVVGFQFHHSAMYTLFKNITSQCLHSDPQCEKTCFTGDYQCYVIDNNGFVVISEQLDETGSFFGEVKPAFMQRLIDDGIFKNVTIYDYQAVCFMAKSIINMASIIETPLKLVWWFLTNAVSYVMWVVLQIFLTIVEAYDEVIYDNNIYDVPDQVDPEDPTAGRYKEPEFHRVLINRTRPDPCDHVITLYELNNDVEPVVYRKDAHQCERPYVVLPIPSSNLILLVLDTLCPLPTHVPTLTTWPTQHDYNDSLACYKARNAELPRRRPLTCINKHANVTNLQTSSRTPATLSSRQRSYQHISIIYQNVRGLRTKIDEFLLSILNDDYDVIVLSETWLNDEIYSNQLFSQNYTVFRQDRNALATGKQLGGGVLIAVAKKLNSQPVNIAIIEEFEQVWAKIAFLQQTVFIGVVYLSPDIASTESLIEKHMESATVVLNRTHPQDTFLLFGDYNQPDIAWIPHENGYMYPDPLQSHFTPANTVLLDKAAFMDLKQINATRDAIPDLSSNNSRSYHIKDDHLLSFLCLLTKDVYRHSFVELTLICLSQDAAQDSRTLLAVSQALSYLVTSSFLWHGIC